MEAGCIIVPLFLGALVIWFFINQSQLAGRAAEERKAAWASYQQALSALKNNPRSPELRERALQWGRHFSNLSRDNQGVTMYDEIALGNDIGAACAGAAATVSSKSAAPSDHASRLERLNALKQQGLISSEEYESKRSAILSEL